MKSTAKTTAVWVLLLVTAILLYNLFAHPSTGNITELTFTKFLDEVNNKNVRSAKIVDYDLTGTLVSGKSFRTVVPTEYPALYDKLQGIDLKIEHRNANPLLAFLFSWGPILLVIGVWIFFMRRMRDSAQNRNEPNLIQLDPDVAKAFSNSQAVNNALRLVIQLKDIPGTA